MFNPCKKVDFQMQKFFFRITNDTVTLTQLLLSPLAIDESKQKKDTLFFFFFKYCCFGKRRKKKKEFFFYIFLFSILKQKESRFWNGFDSILRNP